MARTLALFFSLFFLTASAHAEDLELPPVSVTAPPVDVFLNDPVLSPQKIPVKGDSTQGSIHGQILNSTALPVSDYGTPGGLGQVRGYARTASETAVQTLGVPLNLPQGVGYDFSVFPQFLWQSARVQAGVGSLALDPRATAGTVTLSPWTAATLDEGRSGLRVTQFAWSEGLFQSSVGYSNGESAAVNAGYSAGDASGPSGSASARRALGEGDTLEAHVLASKIDVESPGSLSYKTPNATQSSTRAIPVLQFDRRRGGSVFKASAFYDHSDYHYDNPDDTYDANEIKSRQLGGEAAWTDGAWRLGGVLRSVSYETETREAPREAIATLHAGRVFRPEGKLIDLGAEALAASRFGFHPAVTAGARRDLDDAGRFQAFARVRGAARLPTLSDRYFSDPYFKANPGLEPETVWSSVLGLEWRSGTVRASLSAQGQLYRDAMVREEVSTGVYTVKNNGQAWVAALVQKLEWELSPAFVYEHEVGAADSEVETTGRAFPYIPTIRGSAALAWRPGGPDGGWRLEAREVFSGPVDEAGGGTGLGGYGRLDLGARARVLRWGSDGQGLEALFRLENVLDASIQLVKDYPQPGRNVALTIQATL